MKTMETKDIVRQEKNILFVNAFKNLVINTKGRDLGTTFDDIKDISYSIDRTLENLGVAPINEDIIEVSYIDWLENNKFLNLS